MEKGWKQRWLCGLSVTVLFVTTAIAGLAGTGYAAEEKRATEDPYVEGQVLVAFEEGTSEKTAEQIAAEAGGEAVQTIASIQPEETCLVTLEEGMEVEEAVKQLETEKKVLDVQPNYIYSLQEMKLAEQWQEQDVTDVSVDGHDTAGAEDTDGSGGGDGAEDTDGSGGGDGSGDTDGSGDGDGSGDTDGSDDGDGAEDTDGSANDPGIEAQWHLDVVDARAGWERHQSLPHEKVRVAVLDTGVNIDHEDLQTCLNDTLSVDVTKSKPKPLTRDVDGHGTTVAGILAADTNNGIGVAGVGSGLDNSVDLIAINVFEYVSDPNLIGGDPPGYYAFSDTILRGINYAADHGAKVINMSMGMRRSDTFLGTAINALGKEDITMVSAAGNFEAWDDRTKPYTSYPSDYAQCIGVIATDQQKHRASYSNFGSAKDISAPGSEIYTTNRNGGYSTISGTSMASPVVAGVAAMLYSINPDLAASQVRHILYITTEDLYTKGRDIQSGYGNVNLDKALKKLENYDFVDSVTLSRSSVTMKKGGGFLLFARTTPEYANNPNVIWRSSNTKVATVTADGAVRTKANGTATITATPKDGTPITRSCKVTVPTTGKTTLTKVIRNSKTRSQVTYRRVNGAAGYEIHYCRDKNFKKYDRKVRTTATSKQISNLTSGKKYYFKVRAYKKDTFGNLIFGSYSNVKTNY